MIITKKSQSIKFISLAICFIVMCVSLLAFVQRNNSADAIAGWKAGNIIDDAVMANSATMTVSQIQAFLNSKVPACDTSGTQASEWGGGTRAQYGSSHGNPAPFICLKNYFESPTTKYTVAHTYKNKQGATVTNSYSYTANNYYRISGFKTTYVGGDYRKGISKVSPVFTNVNQQKPAGAKSAAQLIYDISKQYRINPQVLLVLLQKEQSLISDTWPFALQYYSATGYGCPDTAPCSPQYANFYNQVKSAASMFRAFLDNTYSYSQFDLGNNYILYNPSTSCGGSNVNIENRATQALYTYTPYQPNQGALNAGWGTASCGAYGNRNFYLYFNDWFGSTREAYSYRFERLVGQSPAVMAQAGGASRGEYTKTLTVGEKIYIFYYDSTNKTLRYSLWNGSRWSDNLLDGSGATTDGAVTHDVGAGIDAMIYKNNQIQLYYYDATSGDLRHGRTTSNGWSLETMDGSSDSLSGTEANVGKNPQVITYGNGIIQLYYYDQTNGDLRHAWWSDSKWRFEVMDGNASSLGGTNANVGSEVSLITYGPGVIQIYYYDQTNGDLRHAWWSDSKWRFEVMDGNASSLGKNTTDVGSEISLISYGRGVVQLYYYDKTNGELRHAWWDNGRWSFEVMDGNSSSVMKNVINAGKHITAKYFNNRLFVFYYDDATGFSGRTSSWRYAYWSGFSWVGGNLDGGIDSKSGSSSIVSGELSADIHKNQSLQIYYKDSTGGLAHAWILK